MEDKSFEGVIKLTNPMVEVNKELTKEEQQAFIRGLIPTKMISLDELKKLYPKK